MMAHPHIATLPLKNMGYWFTSTVTSELIQAASFRFSITIIPTNPLVLDSLIGAWSDGTGTWSLLMSWPKSLGACIVIAVCLKCCVLVFGVLFDRTSVSSPFARWLLLFTPNKHLRTTVIAFVFLAKPAFLLGFININGHDLADVAIVARHA